MGFFKWLFGKKKRDVEEEDWEQLIYAHDHVDFHNAEERKRYLTGCMEQMGEAGKELNLLTGEYSLVTAYLTDLEEIEALPPEQGSELKTVATKMQGLEQERKRFQDKKQRMSENEYRQIRSQEEEIEEGIKKLTEAEKYQKLIKQDLTRLDGERHAYSYRKGELYTLMGNLRGMAAICLVALAACILMLLLLQFGFSLETAVGYYLAVAAAAIAITVLFVKYMDAQKELTRVEKATNKLIQLQNTVKIRYVNNVNLLDYLYLKYGVDNAGKLKKLWDKYKEEKEERRQYAETEAKLEYHRKQLYNLLVQYRVKYPDRLVAQPSAIVDSKERLEIRHGLIGRRQALRKQMEYNRNLAEAASREVRQIAVEYPRYAAEISRMVDRYAKEYS